jgi:hypothetical protein
VTLSIQKFVRKNAFAAFVLTCAVPTALYAETDDPKGDVWNKTAAVQLTPAPRSGCEAARRDAWFQRQMQRTDGDVNPFVELPVRAECGYAVALAEQRTKLSDSGDFWPAPQMK